MRSSPASWRAALRPGTPAAALALASLACGAGLVLVELLRPQVYVVFAPATYLAFHNVVEFFSVMVSLSVFGVGWFTHDQSRDRHALFLSCAFLAIGLMDFMHALAYAGMPAFVTPSSGNKASQLWVAVRLFAAVALLASAWVRRDATARWLSRPVLLAGALTVAVAVFATVTLGEGQLPPAFVPGVGQTPIKRYAEYVIIAILLAAIVAYQRRHARTGDALAPWISAALAVSASSELLFSAYRSVTDTINALGHLYKLAACSLVYRGVFIAAVRAPYGALLESREALAREMEVRAAAEQRLRQSQKLEAIGRLAGGIAHDFNNLLTAITGGIDGLRAGLPDDDPRQRDLADVEEAAWRGAALTRQLLAFSRKQVVEPRVVDVNEIVSGMERMLRRLIGEEIELRTATSPSPAHVRIDPAQLEQVLLNLAVNSRDAMPRGGQLTIETRLTDVAAGQAGWPEAQPGPHVVVAVRDTGGGMSPETLTHLFEPFFTTKDPGKGTGLGLSTVYGIVKQAGGEVHVRSAVAAGTLVEVLLPRVAAPAGDATRPRGGALPLGSETLLVAEDDAIVRRLAARTLRSAGYEVIEAADGEEALATASGPAGARIALLVTDVRMPRLRGDALADRLRCDRPDLPVLFMSGYSEHEEDFERRVSAGDALLRKPFTPAELTALVRTVLDQCARHAPARRVGRGEAAARSPAR